MTRSSLSTGRRGAALWAFAIAITLVAVALSLPPLRRLIEQSMAWHMVVQMPLLMLGGWVFAQVAGLPKRGFLSLPKSLSWNQFGLTGGVATLVVLAYWMLPSSIDRALVVPRTDAFKVISLWSCGVLLRHCANRAPLLVQLFFVGTVLPMLVWAGLYFASTDLRLCNAYSLDSQIAAGQSLVGLAVALAVWWTARAALASRHPAQVQVNTT